MSNEQLADLLEEAARRLRQSDIAPSPTKGRMLSTAEVAREAGVHAQTVRRNALAIDGKYIGGSQGWSFPAKAPQWFAGLRPGEAEQLDWAQVHFKSKTIEVLAHTSKTRDSRFVKMEPALIAWLKPYAKTAGLIAGINLRPRWRSVKEAAGYGSEEHQTKWVEDIMRHSYASYWLALHQNRAELAEMMGNSVNVIKSHYRRPVLKAEAKRYWGLRPTA